MASSPFVTGSLINGSAIESIYSVLKFASGWNLSALTYGPALGKQEIHGSKQIL